jgi:hypothetical protein
VQGAIDRYAGEPSKLVWTICMSFEGVWCLLAMDSTTVLSVKMETLKPLTRE